MHSSTNSFSSDPDRHIPKSQASCLNLKPDPTIHEQGADWLAALTTRNWNPLALSTLNLWAGALKNWIYPVIGDLRISQVHNATVKPLVQALVEAGHTPWTIKTYVLVVKMVVASVTDDEGEPLYIRHWNPRLLDMPRIDKRLLNTPCFTPEIISGLVKWSHPRERMLFTLEGASGLRISELLGLEIDKHISDDCSTLRIVQQAYRGQVKEDVKTQSSQREVDLYSEVARMLQDFIGCRTSGLLFCTRTGHPLTLPFLLRHHLHPALEALGYVNPYTGTSKAGFRAFRRYRNTHLGKCCGLPEGLKKYWMRHADDSMTGIYDQVYLDRDLRKMWAEHCGIGFDLPANETSTK
jgi:integrase